MFGLEDPVRRPIDASSPDESPPVDTDSDGILDVDDNCDEEANTDQADGDDDGAGDVCDVCPALADNQHDEDGDGLGDRCDNCPNNVNVNQANQDSDGLGDACDASTARECIIRFDGFGTLERWTPVRGTWVIENDALVQTDLQVLQALIVTDETYNRPRVDTVGRIVAVNNGAIAIGVFGNATPTVDATHFLPNGMVADLFENGSSRVVAVTDINGSMLTTLNSGPFPSAADIAPGMPFLVVIDLTSPPAWGMLGIVGSHMAATNANNGTAVPDRVGLRVHNASVRFNSAIIIERRVGACPTPLQ